MFRRFVGLAAAVVLVASVAAGGPRAEGRQGPPVASRTTAAPSEYEAVLRQYCVTCHNQRLNTAGLALDQLDLSDIAAAPDVWEKVIRKVSVGMMPPQGSPRPDEHTQQALVASLSRTLDEAAAARPIPGRPVAHRLNRAEYANAIRDLLALDVDPASLLPPDDSGYGFDNIADVLGLSPVLLERYLTAAGKIAARAVGDPETGPAGETFRIRQDASQDVHVEGLPHGTVGGLLGRTTLPLDGEYDIQVRLYRSNLGVMRGLENPHELEIVVDGERVHLGSFGGAADFKATLDNPTAAADAVDARLALRLNLKAGPHAIGAAFLQIKGPRPWRLQPFIRSSTDTLDVAGEPHVDTVTITGPFNPTGPGDTPSRRRIFVCRPAGAADENTCARRIVSTVARRAYRRPITDADMRPLLEFYRKGREARDFDRGIQFALQRILADPEFVFRVEQDPPDAVAGIAYHVRPLDLGSRLSFFLWSSIPDDELLAAAVDGSLGRPAVLEREVRRMLVDPKSNALVANFAGQWLYLRNLKNQIPNWLEFPDFDDNLRQAFQRETELFFESVMREDRSVLDLMTADYTFVNERLARHYGMANVYGSHFRRVRVPEERRGLLGKGAILMVSSHTDRTSPVVRGKWILDNLLGAPPPAPPADVPPLPEPAPGEGKTLTVRQRLEEHRASPACANCHKLMDPIGFSLENFDAVGAWRTRDGGTRGTPIDASGQLMDGTAVDGVVSLRQALLRRPEIFVSTVTEKLMTYALGRGLTASDMPVVRQIVRDAARANYRFSSLVLGIVKSVPFQMRMKAIEDEGGAAVRATARVPTR